MKITPVGVQIETVNDILIQYTKKLQSQFGGDYSIKAESALDNIIVVMAYLKALIEEQILFVIRQYNIQNAQSEYLDALCERKGQTRKLPELTRFTKKVFGTPNSFVEKNDLRIQSKTSGYFFVNSNDFTFDEEGEAEVDFEGFPYLTEEVASNEPFIIANSSTNVKNLELTTYNINIGFAGETDLEFRERYNLNLFKSPNKGSRNGIISHLLEYVETPDFLNISDPSNDPDIPACHIKIIAKPNVDNTTFANEIFKSICYGVETLGEIETPILRNNSQVDTIRFVSAKEVPVTIWMKLKFKPKTYHNSIVKNVKEEIISYVEEKNYGLNTKLSALEFIKPTLKTSGLEGVIDIKIKRKNSSDYASNIEFSPDEYPTFNPEDIIYEEYET